MSAGTASHTALVHAGHSTATVSHLRHPNRKSHHPTPHLHAAAVTCRIRALQPHATEATDEDALELMEMILGALGRDAVGLGSRWGRASMHAMNGPLVVGFT